MRGKKTAADIIDHLDIDLNPRCRPDYLLRRLHTDCRRMKCDGALLTELRRCRCVSLVVLATDNMDCFWESISGIDGIKGAVDAILCSSVLGVLKDEGVNRFFGPWLETHRLTFKQALLLDDSVKVCAEFEAAGGTAVTVRSSADAINGLRKWLRDLGLRGSTWEQVSIHDRSLKCSPSNKPEKVFGIQSPLFYLT